MSQTPHAVATLEQALVDDYCRKATQKSSLEKNLGKMREQIIAAFEAGAVCPLEGPALVELVPQDKPEFSAKDLFVQYLMQHTHASRELATLRVETFLASAPRKPVPSLRVKLNPEYRP